MLYGIAVWGWRIIGTIACAQFDKTMRKFYLMSTRCIKTTSNKVLFRFMKTVNFSTLAHQEVMNVALLQLNLARGEEDFMYVNERAMSRTLPTSMEHFFVMCKRGLSEESLDVVYENLLDYYKVALTEWISTNTCVHERRSAIWGGARREGWVIYTDASVSSYGAGWSFTAYRHGFCVSIQNSVLTKCSIHTTEAQAIRYAVQYASEINGLSKKETVEIRSDSLSVVRALERIITVDPVLLSVKQELTKAGMKGVNILLRWIPMGIEGNEMADRQAKKAVDSVVSRPAMIVKRDLRAEVRKKNRAMVVRDWEKVESHIPRQFFPEISSFEAFLHSSPSAELCQLVTGHCRLNKFLCNKLRVVSSALCACNLCDKTVTHYLLECPLYAQTRCDVWGDFQPTFE